MRQIFTGDNTTFGIDSFPCFQELFDNLKSFSTLFSTDSSSAFFHSSEFHFVACVFLCKQANLNKHLADDMSSPLSPIPVPAQKQLKYTAGIVNASVRESAAFMDQTRKVDFFLLFHLIKPAFWANIIFLLHR